MSSWSLSMATPVPASSTFDFSWAFNISIYAYTAMYVYICTYVCIQVVSVPSLFWIHSINTILLIWSVFLLSMEMRLNSARFGGVCFGYAVDGSDKMPKKTDTEQYNSKTAKQKWSGRSCEECFPFYWAKQSAELCSWPLHSIEEGELLVELLIYWYLLLTRIYCIC